MGECGLGSCAVTDLIIITSYYHSYNRNHWKYKPQSVQIYINALYLQCISALSGVCQLLPGFEGCQLGDGFIFRQTTWDVGSCEPIPYVCKIRHNRGSQK